VRQEIHLITELHEDGVVAEAGGVDFKLDHG
jgi:hypothetical protein